MEVESGFKKKVTPTIIFELARTNPIVNHGLELWKVGAIDSWEQALSLILVLLCEQNQSLKKDFMDLKKYGPPPVFIEKNSILNSKIEPHE